MAKPNSFVGQSGTTNLQPDGGYNYRRPVRFKNMSALMARYEDAVKKRGDQRAWNNILRAFNRDAWKDSDGTVLPNFGFLRSKVEDKINSYTDYATERENLVSVKTYEGDTPQQTKLWSDHLTHAFNKFGMGRWRKRFMEIILAARDMCLFSKGALTFLDDGDLYPTNLPIQNVWPDSNAGMTADSFDTLFIEQRYTRVELYRKVASPDCHLKGWNRENVLSVLQSANDSWRDATKDEVFLKYKQGETTAQDEDGVIDVVWAFVKEYARTPESTEENETYDSKPSISFFVFVRNNHVPKARKRDTSPVNQQDQDAAGYLLYKPRHGKCMDEVLSILAQSVCRNFYEDPSVAEQNYTTAKVYDQVMNRILQGVEDNMRVYLSSTSADGFNKLKRMKHGNTTILEPGMTIAQQAIRRPIQEAMAALQLVSNESNSLTQSYNVNSRDQGGGYKTAEQTRIDFNQSLKIDSASLKVFNQFCTFMVQEIYRRFLSVENPCEEYDKESQTMFKKYLRKHQVPESAWKPENCKVESILDLGAASPAARLQAAQVTSATLAQPARSEGERQSQRDAIAAVHGVDNVDTYLPPIEVQTEEDWKIGMENDALMSPGGNPNNVPVLATQLHMRHLPRHLEDGQMTLQRLAGYFQSLDQLNPEDRGVHTKTIMDQLIGLDQLLAHSRAHIELASRTQNKSQIAELKQYAAMIETLAGQMDKLEQALAEQEQARMQQAMERTGQDPKLMHQQRMDEQQFFQQQRMDELAYASAVQKGQQLQNQSAQNAMTKQQLEVAKKENEIRLDNQKSLVDIAISARQKVNIQK